MLGSTRTLLFCLWSLSQLEVSSAFSISIAENVVSFTNVMLNWTRDESDPTDFWFNSLQLGEDGSLTKELSLQVSNTGDISGSMPFVFVNTGAHIIQIATDENADVFNSTSQVMVTAANSSSSCSSSGTSATVTVTATATATAFGSASNASHEAAIIGATIGTIIPITIIAAIITVKCILRRNKSANTSQSEPDSSTTNLNTSSLATVPSAVPFSFNPQTRAARIITPFVDTDHNILSRSKDSPPSQPPFRAPSSSKNSSLYGTRPSIPASGEEMVLPSSSAAVAADAASSSSGSRRAPRRTDNQVHHGGPQRSTTTQMQTPSISSSSVSNQVQPPLTERQQLLEEEASKLRLQIMNMVTSALTESQVTTPSESNQSTAGQHLQNIQNDNRELAAQMERMREQITMLEEDRDSAWARGLDSEPPSYLSSLGIQQ